MYQGIYPGMISVTRFDTQVPESTLDVPVYLAGYDQYNQVWYPATPEYILKYPAKRSLDSFRENRHEGAGLGYLQPLRHAS